MASEESGEGWAYLPEEMVQHIMMNARLTIRHLRLLALTSRNMRRAVEDPTVRKAVLEAQGASAVVWGRGLRGQMGCGKLKIISSLHPRLLCLPSGKPSDENIAVSVAASKSHTLMVSRSGDLFACGCSSQGKLGGVERRRGKRGTDARWVRRLLRLQIVQDERTDTDEDGDPWHHVVAAPAKMATLIKVRQVACGSNHSLVLSQDGLVFSFGKGDYGGLGHGDRSTRTVPTLISPLARRPASFISVGRYHSHVILESGLLLGFGGADPFYHPPAPVVIPEVREERFVATAGGDCFALALTEDGRVYMMGCVHGRALRAYLRGFPPPKDVAARRVRLLQKTQHPACDEPLVSSIAAGSHHALLLTRQGQIYSIGENKHGQLGRFSSAPDEDTALPVGLDHDDEEDSFKPRFKAIAAAADHSLALTEDGRLFAFGVTFRTTPQEVPLPRLLKSSGVIKGIAAGGRRNYILL